MRGKSKPIDNIDKEFSSYLKSIIKFLKKFFFKFNISEREVSHNRNKENILERQKLW